jgi:GDP-mannose 6-dehydrogenase
VGSNRAYIEQAIPHIAALMCDTLEDAVRGADVVIASHGINSELAGVLRAGQTVIDLARTATDSVQIAAEVEGICW